MKITAILLLAACVQASATGIGQKVSLSMRDVPVQKVFREVSRQTGISIVYNENVFSGFSPVTVVVKEAALEQVLNKCLTGQPVTYSVESNSIVIRRKDRPATPVKPAETGEPAPPVDIKGKVENERGEPLEGVSVIIKGTRRGTFTDAKGAFSLNNVAENSILVFSGVSIETQEIAVNGRSEISVRLATRSTSLTDVTVQANTGFQSISRERSTGSYNVITQEQLEKPSSNIGQRLIGTTSGVQASLDVNGNPTFQIRGLTSLYANSQPLIVVDGFPIQGDFNSINPNDVESVTILKDAAAASIWGARSANGVIVIVTKKARRGTH